MNATQIPETVNEFTKICRICLSTTNELYPIHDFGKICEKTVKISDLLTECTSIEFNEDDNLPSTICSNCLLQTCKISKFREMAFISNILLRQKRPKAQPTWQKTPAVQTSSSPKQEMNVIIENPEIEIAKDEHEMVDLIQTVDSEDPDNEVEYVTVILANEESADSVEGDDIEGLIDETSETEVGHEEGYIVADELEDVIPKMSLKRPRSRKRNKDSDDRSLTCTECGKTLSNFSSYKYHMQLHSDKTPFLCSQCGEGFKTRNAYDGHLVTHLESNPNTCGICGKVYRQNASLRSHMLTHSGEKPFKCEICGKGMTQKSGYKKHLLTHTGEKPHACDECGREFRYSSNLIMHKRSHVGHKDFECLVCKKSFISKEQLKRHATIHTGVKPYQCQSCNKCFNRRSTLSIHQKVHKKLKCKLCDDYFDSMAAVTAHEKRHADENSSVDQ